MAFFKFRLPNPGMGEDGSSGGTSGESLEALRRRARQRLIGATVLVLLAVIGFPILFDTQPRPVSVDIPIDIPDKQKTSPQVAPVAVKPSADSATTAHGASSVSTQASLEHNEEVLHPAASAATKHAATPTADSHVAKADAVTKTAVAEKPAADKTASDKSTPEKPASDKPAEAVTPRFVVQVGAYADDAKAREVRARLEKAGLKTYTHVAETKDGKRTRVRLGPFATKEEADKAAARAKAMNLQATILSL
jgi:DedD protein